MRKMKKALLAGGLSSLLVASTVLPVSAIENERKATTKTSIQPSAISGGKTFQQQMKEKVPMSETTFIVKYNKPITSAEHRSLGGTVIREFNHLNYAEIKVKNKKDLVKVMKKYQKLSKVSNVSPSILFSHTSIDPKANLQYQHNMLQIDKAQKLAGKNKVTVAVIDTGTDPKHPDLRNSLLPGYNAANPAKQPVSGDHGTHVSGIIAATKNNGIGGYGVSPSVKILPIDVFDGRDGAADASITEGILYAVDKGAKVINMSLGAPVNMPLVEDAIQYAMKKGVTIVAAAGNESIDKASYPASYEGVISVGSINKFKELSYYSNYGPSVDVVAPGEDVYSTVYDVEKKSSFTHFSGTSMASPVTAGAAALLLTKYPKLTPIQVEYILERTANDLGEKGFDTKFANGLIDPVKALQFDMKKLPAYINKNVTPKEILQNAQSVEIRNEITQSGSITKYNEQKWIKFNVKKGEYIQTILEGSKQFDYKIMGHFVNSDASIVESFEVNQLQEGTLEAELVQAPFDGTVAIGVKDVNNNFDDSGKKASSYKLTVQKAAELPKDESSVEKMINVERLPYNAPQPLTIAGAEKDYDYFSFKLDKEQLVKIDMSAIPGLNTKLDVYNITNLFPEEEATEKTPANEPAKNTISEEDKQQMLRDYLEGEEGIPGDFSANSGKIGQPETLSFIAEANQEYVVKISGDAESVSMLEAMINMFLGLEMKFEDNKNLSSLVPYTLNINSKNVIKDEDGLDTMFEPEGNELVNGLSSTSKIASANIKSAADPVIDEETDTFQNIIDHARPYGIGNNANGYIQSETDEDYFLLEPTESAIYEFGITNRFNQIPAVEITELIEEEGEEGEPIIYTKPVASNILIEGFDVKMNTRLVTGLQKGKRYLIKLASNSMLSSSAVSYEPYYLQSKKIANNPEDQFEPSNYENIKDLPAQSFKGNFAMANDTDVFYYKAKETGIAAVTAETAQLTNAMKNMYPKELLTSYQGFIHVVEDRNKNRKFEPGIDQLVLAVQDGLPNFTSGSFKMYKGRNYIIEIVGVVQEEQATSVIPYTFQFNTINKKDETTATKPIAMKKSKDGSYNAKGYLNANIAGGDIDYYNVEFTKNVTGKIQLLGGKELDGVISIYQNNKLLKKSDLYLQGDTEEMMLNLKKGKYQIRVEDSKGQASITPYTLKVNMK